MGAGGAWLPQRVAVRRHAGRSATHIAQRCRQAVDAVKVERTAPELLSPDDPIYRGGFVIFSPPVMRQKPPKETPKEDDEEPEEG